MARGRGGGHRGGRNLSDEAARRAIREDLDRTLLVEAGAGTGKTRALVERVVALVRSGRPIERIVAITFTEKAAAELRDRIRGELAEAAGREADDAVRERLETALRDQGRASISTIHAFGQVELKAFAAEAGLDPDFSVLDDVAATRRFSERWRGWLEELPAEGPEGAAIDRALELGLRPRDLRALAERLAGRPDVLERLLAGLGPSAPDADWSWLDAARAEIRALPLDGVAGDDRLLVLVERQLHLLDALAADGAGRAALLAAGWRLTTGACNRGRADAWGGGEVKARAVDVAERTRDLLARTLADARAAALAALRPPLARFLAHDALARRREGTLVFDDLIVGLRDLLVHEPAARAALRARVDALLIDEFQDTDPVQVDIAIAFAEGEDGRLDPGRVFLVGDPKQSIYRFRQADMAIYADTRDRVMADGGEVVGLDVNRRSQPAILEWVNRVFASLLGEGDDPRLQPAYRPVGPERSGALPGPGVSWFGGASDDRAADVRRTESYDVARACRAAVDEGWRVAERDGTPRPVAFRDIAVLIPRRTGLPSLERALVAAGVPYRVEGGSLIFRTQEVRDLINCLAAVDDPSDQVAVVAALRSPAFACSDADLARHRAAGGSFSYLAPGLDAQDGPVAEGLRGLARHHAARREGSLARLVERVVAEWGLVEVGVLDSAGRNALRRARYVIEQARGFEAAGPESLRAFVAWLEERAEQGVLDLEGAGLDDDEDAVRVLTVHGAKGLEFPVVIVAGLSVEPGEPEMPVLGRPPALALAVGSAGRGARFTLGDVDALLAGERGHAGAELRRLLYVAATRARDHLVLSLHHRAKATGCAAAILLAEGAAEGVPEWALPERGAGVAAGLDGLPLDLPTAADAGALAAEREALMAHATTLRVESATSLGARSVSEEPWSRGRGGTRLGRAVHAALQALPLTADAASVTAVARAQAVAEAVPGRAGEVARLVLAAHASEAAGRARAAVRALREVPFAATVDGVLVEGFIDLVVDGPDGLEIIDWKTDDVAEDGLDDRLDGYRLQAGLYALGLGAATGRPVDRITYVFVRPRAERSPGRPADLATAARARLAGVAPPAGGDGGQLRLFGEPA